MKPQRMITCWSCNQRFYVPEHLFRARAGESKALWCPYCAGELAASWIAYRALVELDLQVINAEHDASDLRTSRDTLLRRVAALRGVITRMKGR